VADFCLQCSKDLGAPEGWSDFRGECAVCGKELAGGCDHDVLCEGCGPTRTGSNGECLLHTGGCQKTRRRLFVAGDFVLHSGGLSYWKIDCDALADSDTETLALLIAQQFHFDRCEWVATGGERLGKVLQGYLSSRLPHNLLIVDDVLTTGASMEEQRAGREAIGVVIFARGPCPSWVTPLFRSFES